MNNIIGENEFCGPSVMSAICGITTDQAEHYIRCVTGQTKKVKGVFSQDLVKAFSLAGYDSLNLSQYAGGSLFGTVPYLHNEGTYVLVVPGHFIAVEKKDSKFTICDSHRKIPLNLSASARLGQKVVEIWYITQRVDKVHSQPKNTKRRIKITIEVDTAELIAKAPDYKSYMAVDQVVDTLKTWLPNEFVIASATQETLWDD